MAIQNNKPAKLTEYQKTRLDMMIYGTGVMRLPCGTGKIVHIPIQDVLKPPEEETHETN